MNGLRLTMFVLVLVLIAAGCAPAPATVAPSAPDSGAVNNNPPPAASGSNTQLTLANTQWRLASLGPKDSAAPVAQGTNITLEFQSDGKAGGFSGCNSYGGNFQLNGAQLSFGDMMSTMRACADERDTQEQEYIQALSTSGNVAQTGENLTIWYANGQNVLNFVQAQASISPTDPASGVVESATPTIALVENQQWTLVSFGASGSEVAVLPSSQVTMSIEDGEVRGSSGCNSYQGAFESEMNQINIETLAVTKKACADPQLTEQESKFLAALQAAEMFEVENNRLTILYDGGHSQLNFAQ